MKYFTKTSYTDEELKSAYRELCMHLHPDKNEGNDAEFKLMQAEYLNFISGKPNKADFKIDFSGIFKDIFEIQDEISKIRLNKNTSDFEKAVKIGQITLSKLDQYIKLTQKQ